MSRFKTSILVLAVLAAAVPFAGVTAEEETAGEKESIGARTLLQPCPVWIIGSYDGEGRPNAMTASWVSICCSKPPCVSVALRDTRYTFGNIMQRKAFTVSIPSESHASEAAYLGSVSGKDVDKFAAARLTPVKGEVADAPYIAEFPLVVECKLLHTYEIGVHTLIIGEILDVKADKAVLGDNGLPDVEKLKPLLFAPGSGKFYGAGASIGTIVSFAEKITKESAKVP